MSRTTSFSRYSVYKQTVLSNVVKYLSRKHLNLVENGVREEEFAFVDSHGGLGMWRNTAGERCLGSPVVIYRNLEAEGVRYRGFVFEKNVARHEQLEKHLSFSQWPVTCYPCDNLHAPDILQQQYMSESASNNTDVGGLIYYDCDGHGSSDEISRITSNNRMDILIHCCSGKRSMYRHCSDAGNLYARSSNNSDMSNAIEAAQNQPIASMRAEEIPSPAYTHDLDHNVIQNIEHFNRPYWYIGTLGEQNSNKFQFVFLFGSHMPLEMMSGYSTPITAQNHKGEDYEFQLNNHLCPIYSKRGIKRQHSAFYSIEDMKQYDDQTDSLNLFHQPGNYLPFRVVTGQRYDAEVVGEGSVSSPQLIGAITPENVQDHNNS